MPAAGIMMDLMMVFSWHEIGIFILLKAVLLSCFAIKKSFIKVQFQLLLL